MKSSTCSNGFMFAMKLWITVMAIALNNAHAGTLSRQSKLFWPAGSDVSLEWTYEDGQSQTLHQIKFGVMDSSIPIKFMDVDSNGSAFPISQLPPAWTWYQGRVSWVGNLANKRITFELTNAALNDSRAFYCNVQWQGFLQEKTSIANIVITEPPVITNPVFQNPYVEGNKVDVGCNATGIPTPTVKWVKESNGQILSSGEGSVRLIFNTVNKDNAGYYRCKANNTAATKQTEPLKLVVHYPVSITQSPQNQTKNENEQVSLVCKAAGFPEPSISWSRVDSSPLQGDTNKSTYSIASSKRGDTGQYKCTATNNVGGEMKEVTAVAFVNVQYEPSVSTFFPNVKVNESDPLTLRCTADGNPKPVISWRKSSSLTVLKEGNTYVKPQASKDDSGSYTCTASSVLKPDAKATIVVIVQYKPKVDTGVSNSTVGSWDNNDVTLQCVARGVPAATFSWFKPGGQKITSNIVDIPNGSRVTVTTSVPGDYGQYKCRATNEVGRTDHNITVIQWTKPGKPLKVTLKEIEASYIKLAWAPPANDGGSPVIDYKIEILKNTDAKPKVFDDKVTGKEKLIDQLTPGASYSVLVYARNIVAVGDVALITVTTKTQGKPGISMLKNTTKKISTADIELTWAAAAENGGKILTYTLWWREVETNGGLGKWISRNTSSNAVTYTVTELKFGRIYQFGITAWNKYGRSALDEEKGLIQVEVIEPTSISRITPGKSKGVDAAAIGGGVAAAIIIILVVAVVIVVLKRRKASPGKGESRDPLGDEGYSSVTNASAARRLGRTNASNEAAGIPTYATVDMSKKTPKKPDLIYAELADFDNSAARAASMNRRQQPKRYEPTDYAEIAQFGRPSAEPMYDNVPRY